MSNDIKKLTNMERFIKLIKITTLTLPGLLVIYLIINISGSEEQKPVSFEPGKNEGLTSHIYDKHNNVSMVIKSSESFPAKMGTKFRDIEIKKIKKNRELGNITITGEKGFISFDMHYVAVTGNARIVSRNIYMESSEFLLKAKNEVRSTHPVKYYSKAYKGIGKKGSAFYLKQKMYKFLDTEGFFIQEGKKYKYKADILWFWDEKQMVIFDKNSVITGNDLKIESDKLFVIYTEDRKHITKIACTTRGRMIMGTKAKGNYKEMKSVNIDTRHPHEGKIDLIHLREQAEITIISKKSTMKMNSDEIKIRFSTETGKITRVEMLRSGSVNVESDTPFTVSSHQMFLNFKDGDLVDCDAKDVSDFKINEYSGSTPRLLYNVMKKNVDLKGSGSRIFQKGNRFTSRAFFIDTDKKALSSKSGVKSSIKKKFSRQKTFLSSSEIMINAAHFTIDDSKNSVKYGGDVQLIQKGLNLKTNHLSIPANGDIIANGESVMTFFTGKNETLLTGNRIFMDAENNRIYLHSENGESGLTLKGQTEDDDKSGFMVITGIEPIFNTIIEAGKTKRRKVKKKSEEKDSSLFADIILIELNKKSDISFITGRRNIKFDKGKIKGSSNDVKWYFKKETMVFNGDASLGTSDGSFEKGDTLELKLDRNLITTRSKGRSRTETLIK